MDWQLLLVGLLVAGAAGYLVRQTWRTWTVSKTSCGGGCDCGGKATAPTAGNGRATLIPPEQLSVRRRQPHSG
jgi:hypothetical protein